MVLLAFIFFLKTVFFLWVNNVITLKSDDRRAIATVDAKTGEFTLGYRLYSEEDDKFHK